MAREDLSKFDDFLNEVDALIELVPTITPVDVGISSEDLLSRINLDLGIEEEKPEPILPNLSSEYIERLGEVCISRVYRVALGELPAALLIQYGPEGLDTVQQQVNAEAKLEVALNTLEDFGIYHPDQTSSVVSSNNIDTRFQNLGGGIVSGTELVVMRKDMTEYSADDDSQPVGHQLQILLFNAQAKDEILLSRNLKPKTVEKFKKYRDMNRSRK